MQADGSRPSGGASKARVSVYERVTERITDLLQQGTVPWRKPWNAHVGPPRNGVVRQILPGPQRLHVERCRIRFALVVFAQTGQCPGRPHQEGRKSQLGSLLETLGSQG